MRIGVHFDERILEGGQKELDLGKEGGHSKRRVLHYHDTTGREIEQRLLDAAVQERNIQILDNHMAVDLITTGKLGYTTEDRVIGVYVLNDASGIVETIRSDRVILATGGCGKVYLYTTNPDVATGDGVAMAWRAGAAVANMEFIQFHPTCLFHPEKKSFLISEAVRGEGGKLVDASGREFMAKYHKLGRLGPPRRRRARHRRRDEADRREMHVHRYYASARRVLERSVPKHLRDMYRVLGST